jgi:hypothetical protein
VADWLGDSDLAALRPYFELSGDPVVLLLDRLSGDEQRAVLQAQWLSASDAHAFLREAADRALGDFLENPQNLIMLLRAVQTGQWPATRKELFELSTQIMLKEFDMDRARSGSGIYTIDELRPAAGAVCAARLISDIEAVGLADQEASTTIPSYRSLSMIPLEKVIAALGRRIFVAGPAQESVDYAHRTTAEYLGAAWLADAVRNGMPLGRLQAPMGIDGHPAPQLRGLHAWLAVHLPEHANRLIDTDPYGVLTYGDAASLTQSSCAHLVKSLGKLSQSDPWFRSGNWRSPAIGALSRADMVDEFRAVLRSNNAGFGVRSIVVEAAAIGTPMPALKDDLLEVVLRTRSPFSERLHALIALLRIGPQGERLVESAFHRLGTDADALRLRAEMILQMYGKPFGPADITALLKDITASTGEMVTGVLYTFSEDMPLGAIPAVLDELQPLEPASRTNGRHEWEVARFIDRVLIRGWRGMAEIEPARALQWLRLRHSYSGGYGRRLTDNLRAALRERQDRLRAITDYFFEMLVPDQDRWLQLSRFREVTFLEVAPEKLLDHIIAHMERATAGGDKELFLYEAALRTTFTINGPKANAMFEKLFALADHRADLRALRDGSMLCVIPTGLLSRPPHNDGDTEHVRETVRRNFERDADAIRNGTHLGWLTLAAQVYFGLLLGVDENASPRERLLAVLGETNAHTAIAGFIAALSRTDLPSLAQVAALSAEHQHYNWWRVLTAGLIELWQANQSLPELSDELVKAALAFDLTNPAFVHTGATVDVIVPGWKTAMMHDRPELVRDAYVAIARIKLTKDDQMVAGLRELMVEDAFKPFRAETVLELLRDFPDAQPQHLDELFDGVFATPAAHSGFLVLADRVLTGATLVGQRQHDMWLAAAYLLSPSRYEAELEAAAILRPAIVFDLGAHSGYDDAHSDREPSALPLPQLEFLARLTGTLYPETDFPTDGWWGNTNPWDAVEFCRRLINAISAMPSEAATEALRRLEADTKMASYNPYLRHALANQEKRRRESQYDRPDWPSTIKALSNGAPATVGDLHALTLHQFDDLRKRIARENTDIYKSFWNLDRYSRLKTPRPEDACRDTLVTLLRPALAPKGITVEPEGHMVADKRADISVAMPGRKILCEWKRDYHADLWTAADQQLERFYAHDPEAKGFGIYGVLWFGDKRPSPSPKHPDGLELPKLARELEQMLRDRIPVDRRSRLAVLVIDVSGPPATKRKRRQTTANKKKKSAAAKKAAKGKSVIGAASKKARKKPSARKATTKPRRQGSRRRR